MAGKNDKIRLEAHRSYKGLDFKSADLVSEFVKRAPKLKFGLEIHSKDIIKINIGKDCTYLTREKIKGAQGLPVGSSGTGVSLLSGGIDSPVASYHAMKRGIKPIYLHIHGFQSNRAAELKKIRETVSVLSRSSGESKLYLAPFYIFQSMSMRADRKYETVLFKRFLYLLAQKIAVLERAECIITGESVGQVASQTLKNLSATSYGIDALVIRPLICFDKQEIIDSARSIGTMGLSVQPYRDVCSIDLKNVILKANPDKVAKFSDLMNMDGAVSSTFERVSVERISAKWK